MKRRHSWEYRVLAALAAAVLASSAPAGEIGDRPDGLQFDIPAGEPLSAALETFSRVSRVQVLYESQLVFGRQSEAVQGRFSPKAALETLLGGAGLVIRFTRPDAVTLMRPAAAGLAEPPVRSLGIPDLVLDTLRVDDTDTDDSRFRSYASILRGDIERALKSDTKTRAGRYNAGLRLWVDGARTVQRLELVRSTGNGDRDAAISRALHGLVVSEAPPPRMRNPVNIVISVRTL